MDSFPAAKGEQEKKSNDCFLISAPFLLGMQVLRVLSLPTSRHHQAGSCRYQQQEKKTSKWKQQLTMALGPDNALGVGEIGATGNA